MYQEIENEIVGVIEWASPHIQTSPGGPSL